MMGAGDEQDAEQTVEIGPFLDREQSPKIVFEAALDPKDCSYDLIGGQIVVTCAPFSKYSRKSSDVPPPIKPGSKCPGFILTLNGKEKLKIYCPFKQLKRNSENSYWNKQQWLKCLGCQNLSWNLTQNPNARVREQTFVSSQIYHLGSAMAQREGVTETREQCIDLIISVALNGRVADGISETRTENQRKTAYERLESGEGACCAHCGVAVVWKAGQDNQGTVDRLAPGGYFAAGQLTALKRLFNKMDSTEREAFIRTLITKLDFKRADKALHCYLNGVSDDEARYQGIKRSRGQAEYWKGKFENQSQEKREQFKNTPSKMSKRSGKYKKVEDIRNYEIDEFLEFCRVMDNCCVVTGIDDEPRSIDR
ncbi:hypothetical protein HDV05_006626 [Chytridiales sp. JEL 0842]|nr:hypothetical protein HDV05_006626 [Chytridiales sp. JEL 0842]